MINGTNGAERILWRPSGQAFFFETLTTFVFVAMLGTLAVTLVSIESGSVHIGRYESR